MKKIKRSDKIRKKVLQPRRENKTLLNNILHKNANWIGHIIGRHSLHHYVTGGQMPEVRGVARRIQLLDDLRNRRIYWELKEDADDPKGWKEQFID
jgi:hypothetical protein